MRIALIAKPGQADSGVGRYVYELERHLLALGHQVTMVHPVVPIPGWVARAVRRWTGLDLEAFFQNYAVWARYPPADLYHLTSQNLATLMLFRLPPGSVVVTVHDIIPWLGRDNPELRTYQHGFDALFDWLAIQGLKRATVFLAPSGHTRETLERIGIPSERVAVTPLAAEH